MFQNNLLMAAASISAGAYEINYSCRFNTADDAVLSIANGTATSSTTATIAFWFKIGVIGVDRAFFGEEGFKTGVAFLASGQLYVNHNGAIVLTTTQVFRDPSAWYHCVCVYDTTESVDTDRFKIYINGAQITAYAAGTWPTEDEAFTAWNTSGATNLVGEGHSTYANFDGYLSEFHSIDGVAYGPTTFGEFDDYGVWRPIEVTGVTYGNNGFYLDFADSSALGNDVSGNDNDLTSSGLAATDQMDDTPTKNFSTLNPNQEVWNAAVTLSDGNLHGAGSSAAVGNQITGTIAVSSGKWVFASKPTAIEGLNGDLFVCNNAGRNDRTAHTHGAANFWAFTFSGPTSAVTYDQTSSTSRTPSPDLAVGDYQLCALDVDNLAIWYGIYDVSAGTTVWADNSTGWTGDPTDGGTTKSGTLVTSSGDLFYMGASFYTGRSADLDFGQNNLLSNITIPTGFKLVNTANLPEPTVKDGTANFQPIIYTGDGSVRNVDQTKFFSTFKPDNVWIKNRSTTDEWKCVDIVRGVTKELSTNDTSVESTDADGLTSFDSDGFGLGTGAGGYNDNTENFGAYQWLAGGDAGSANAVGSITTTTTSVNTAAGISMGTYTGTGSAATIGHGLGAVPKMVIVKERADDVGSWYVYHAGNTAAPETDYLLLDTAAATADDATVWNDTAPTSTVFSIGTHDDVNGSTDTYVYYAFAEVEGFSKFGTYTGNGVGSGGGPFSYTGFKPTFVVVKRADGSSQWYVTDVARDPYFNLTRADFSVYYLSLNNAESYGYGNTFLSNGFKQFDSAENNTSGASYVYMAFAEYPFGGTNVTPATAF